MATSYNIEQLDKQRHDRSTFLSGVPALDTYLKEQATQEAKRNIAVTYVLCEDRAVDEAEATANHPILGYYTISAATVVTRHLPPEIARRLPRYEALPAILIGRLAVDERQRGRRLGERLLVDALRRCHNISTQMGAMAVITDAKDETAASFYAHYGFRAFIDRPLNLYLPIAEIPR
jgi:predicted GNAT family N-acyltransferase